MRHSAFRNWLLRESNERSWRRSGVTGLSAGLAAAATTATPATALALPCLPEPLLLLPALAWEAWEVWEVALPPDLLLAEVWLVEALWSFLCVAAPAGATASVVINTASAILVLIMYAA